MTPFVNNRDIMTQISNYALIKFTTCEASIREILFYLIKKTMFAWYWIEREPADIIEVNTKPSECEFKNDGMRYLPKNFKHKNKVVYFDHMF